MPNAKLSVKPKGRKYLRGISESRNNKLREYMKIKRVFLRGKRCQYPLCSKAATDVHHTRGRAGTLLTDVRYFAGLCRTHHNWVGENIVKARELGLICEAGKWNNPN